MFEVFYQHSLGGVLTFPRYVPENHSDGSYNGISLAIVGLHSGRLGLSLSVNGANAPWTNFVWGIIRGFVLNFNICLLYTSDAADE